MRRTLLFGSVIFLGFVCISFAADEIRNDANGLLTIGDYLLYAVQHNAGLQASYEMAVAAEEQIPQAKSLPDPKFTFGYYIQEVETRVGPQRNKFDIMQTFPWFGTIEARGSEATAKAKAARQRYEAEKLKLFERIKFSFYEYSYLKRAVDITGENLELMKHFEEIARIRYATSVTTHPDVIRAQIELTILDDRLKSLKEKRPAIVARLNSILNRPADSNLPWPKPPPYEPFSIDLNKLILLIIQNNPNLQALEYDIQAAKNREKLAEKKFYPDIGLGVSYIDTDSRPSVMEDNGKDAIMAMISINLPLWHGNYKAAERQAKAQLRQSSQQKIQISNDLTSNAEQLLYELEDSNRKIRLYADDLIPKATELLAASESAYQAAAVDFLTLIDAQQTLLEYQLFYERKVAENAQALAGIEMLTGTSLLLSESEKVGLRSNQ